MKWVLILSCLGISISYASQDKSYGLDPATIRAGLRFAVEVPFNNLAANTVSQGCGVMSSIKNILNQKGVLGFYAGGTMEAGRSLLWYPRMWFIQQGDGVSEEFRSISKATGISLMEALAMPLFRIRTAMMVESKERFRQELLNVLRTGYAGTGLRSSATWISWYVFFETDAFAKQYFKDNSFLASSFTACSQVGVAALTAPMYVVLINRQKLTDPCSLPFWDALGYHYKRYGLPIFYRTAKLGAGHLALQAGLTTCVTRLLTEKAAHNTM